jgi:hypothetical protein
MGIFGSRHRPELASALMSLANAYLMDLRESNGVLDATIAGARERIDALALAVRNDEGAKGLRKAKADAMTYVWKQLTANPSTSFREGSPARRAHDQFKSFLDELVPD